MSILYENQSEQENIEQGNQKDFLPKLKQVKCHESLEISDKSIIDFHKWVLQNKIELITEKTFDEPKEKIGLWRWARTPIIKKDAGGNFGAIPQGYDYYTDKEILKLYLLDQ